MRFQARPYETGKFHFSLPGTLTLESQPLGWKTSYFGIVAVWGSCIWVFWESTWGREVTSQARYSSLLKAGARHVRWGKKENKISDVEKDQRTIAELRPQVPIQASQSTGPLSGPQLWWAVRVRVRVRGVLPLLSLPDLLTHGTMCLRKWFPFSSLGIWGQCVCSNGLPEME